MSNIFTKIKGLSVNNKEISVEKIEELQQDSRNVFDQIDAIVEKLKSINNVIDLKEIKNLKDSLIKSSKGPIDYNDPKLLDESILSKLIEELESLTNFTEKNLDQYDNLANNDEIEEVFKIRQLLNDAKIISSTDETDEIESLKRVREQAELFTKLAGNINDIKQLIPKD